ncbi:MAG: CBM96 family carbohydrate-binding protein, partial [Planctomycetota bacterium]
MRKFIVLLLMVAVLATAAQAVEFTPDADTFVRGTTTDNYGGDDDLEVKLATGSLNKNFKSVIRFDASFDAGPADLSAATSINLALVLTIAQDVNDMFNLYGV